MSVKGFTAQQQNQPEKYKFKNYEGQLAKVRTFLDDLYSICQKTEDFSIGQLIRMHSGDSRLGMACQEAGLLNKVHRGKYLWVGPESGPTSAKTIQVLALLGKYRAESSEERQKIINAALAEQEDELAEIQDQNETLDFDNPFSLVEKIHVSDKAMDQDEIESLTEAIASKGALKSEQPASASTHKRFALFWGLISWEIKKEWA